MQWIKKLINRQNGRVDWLALVRHYSGGGNDQVLLSLAQKERDTLEYVNEKTLKFSMFTAKAQEMFNNFEMVKRDYKDVDKVQWIIDKTANAPQLSSARERIETDLQMKDAADRPTYDNTVTHFQTIVNKSQKKPGRHLSQLRNGKRGGGNGKSKAPAKGCYASDGSVFYGSYPKHLWTALSKSDKDKVIAARGDGKKTSTAKVAAVTKEDLKDFQKEILAGVDRHVAKLQRQDDGSESDSVGDNAGDQYGGRRSARKKQKKEG